MTINPIATQIPDTTPSSQTQKPESGFAALFWNADFNQPVTNAVPAPSVADGAVTPATNRAQNTPTLTPTVTPTVTPAPNAFTIPFDQRHEQNVVGTNVDGSTFGMNSQCFATKQCADQIASILGGTVTEVQPQGLSQPYRYITGAGQSDLNAGLVADLFAKYGTAPGSQAWAVIDRDLGKPDTFSGVQS